MDVVYLEQDDGEEPAVFPQNGGQFEGLTPCKRYQLCGDATNSSPSAPSVFTHTSGHPFLGVAGEALVSRLCKSTAASTAPPPGRSWSAFKPVAPSLASRRKKATQMRVVEVKKNVDLCFVEVNNSRLQLGDVRSSTFIRVVESDVCLANITELVHNRFETIIPEGDTAVLVDTRVVPLADEEGTRGESYRPI